MSKVVYKVVGRWIGRCIRTAWEGPAAESPKGGCSCRTAPLLYSYTLLLLFYFVLTLHPDPWDFWRYHISNSTISNILKENSLISKQLLKISHFSVHFLVFNFDFQPDRQMLLQLKTQLRKNYPAAGSILKIDNQFSLVNRWKNTLNW